MLDAIDALLERPKSSMFAWTRRDQWHITLQFYGRVDDVDGLREGIQAAAAASQPARLVVRGGGAFPTPKKAQVFWLGVDGTRCADRPPRDRSRPRPATSSTAATASR